jgi:hypothetical protein
MRHFTNEDFWRCYAALPQSVQDLADKNFGLLKSNPHYPSLHFKRVGRYWSVRVGRRYRAVAVQIDEGLIWFWIGTHTEYDKLVGN